MGDVDSSFVVGGDGVSALTIGGGSLALIAGPCVIEDPEEALSLAKNLKDICQDLDLPFVFKASFDKANRTSLRSFRGPGLEAGLEVLARVRADLGIPVVTDVHEPSQAAAVAEVVDLLQVPAFLCRQTDLLVSCGRTGKPVVLKKGQFVAPWDMEPAVYKLSESGASGVLLTERGTTFGYNNLVADLRSLPIMRGLGVPVCFDATHAVQLPGASGATSGGQRQWAGPLARAAVAVGVDALFLEVHPDPNNARSDSATQLPLGRLRSVLEPVLAVHKALR